MYKVVIVDDEYIVVEGIRAIIERERLDFQVAGSAGDGLAGLTLIKKLQPEVIITDIRMPGQNGLEMIAALGPDYPGEVIVISGYQEFEDARRALQLGVIAYIDKPITVAGVRDSLLKAQAILQQQATREVAAREVRREEAYQASCEKLIALVSGADYENWPEVLAETLDNLHGCGYDIEKYKNECYRLVCLTSGIYYENIGKKEEHHMPLYENIVGVTEFAELDLYAEEIIGRLFEKKAVAAVGSVHKNIETILLYLEEHYSEDIGLAEVAEMVGMQYSYLSVLFKEEVGMSFTKYLTRLRLKYAKKFLLEGDKVSTAAERCGYSNYRYFCDIFKKYEGLTPNEYKGTVRKKQSKKADIL